MSVTLNDLIHQVVTGVGTRPRFDPAGNVVPVPMFVALYRRGETHPFARVAVDSWLLWPYAPKVVDGTTKKVVHDEKPAEFVFSVTVPDPEVTPDVPVPELPVQPAAHGGGSPESRGGYAPA